MFYLNIKYCIRVEVSTNEIEYLLLINIQLSFPSKNKKIRSL